MRCTECMFVVTLYYQMDQIGELFEFTYIWDHLLSKFGNLTPYGAHRINPTVLRLILKKYNHILCPVCIFVVTFYDQMVQIVKLFAYNQYLGSSLFKIWVFDPLGSPNISYPPVFQLIWKKCHHALF